MSEIECGIMETTLIDNLKTVEDYRALRGRRYPLWLLLLCVILGTLSECYGYAALEDFCVRHYAALSERLGIRAKRLPSDSTFRRLFEQLDFHRLSECFNQWSVQTLKLETQEWLAVDGKSIKGTVQAHDSSYQNFVNVVSVYSQQQGVVVALQQFENAQDSEIKVVEALLSSLKLTNVVFSFDALHCQKKHCS